MSEPTAQIAFAMARLATLQRAAIWRQAGLRGLTATQVAILHALARHGPARVGALAGTLGVTQPTLSDALAALVAKGLALRSADPADARARQVCLTSVGAAEARALDETPAALSEALERLPVAERGAMLRALSGVIRGLQRAGAIPVERMCVTCRHFRPYVHEDAAAPHHCGFVDAAFGDGLLRIDCGDHAEATEEEARTTWARFAAMA